MYDKIECINNLSFLSIRIYIKKIDIYQYRNCSKAV